MKSTISDDVGYEIRSNIEDLYDKTMTMMAKGKRLIVLYGGSNVNDSYKDEYYTESLTNPDSVLKSLAATVEKTGNYQYTVLQLQDTGSGALLHIVPEILAHLASWSNDVLFSKTGNLQQATKPIFDNATYQWLTQESAVSGIAAQHGPVIAQNDFVDVALYGHTLALTLKRYHLRNQREAKMV